MITSEGNVNLIDFGLALNFKRHGSISGPIVTDYQASQRVGVFGYMPPEVYSCKPYGTAVDIFSFGVVLQRMLCAAKPLPCVSKVREMALHTLWDVLQVGYVRFMCTPSIPQVSNEMVDICRASMAVAPEQRPSAAQIVTRLEAAAEELQVTIPQPELPTVTHAT